MQALPIEEKPQPNQITEKAIEPEEQKDENLENEEADQIDEESLQNTVDELENSPNAL